MTMKRPFEVYTDKHSVIVDAENMTQAIQIYMESNSYDTPVSVDDIEARNKIKDWFDNAKLATPQKEINLDEVEKLVQHSKNIHRAFGHIWNDMEGTPEEHAIKLRQRIGYTLSDLSPSKPDNNG